MRVVSDSQYQAQKVYGHYFQTLEIENVRCFGRRQTLRLADEAGKPFHWTIILGENGTGKTSLLRALVSVAPSPKVLFRDKQELHLYPGMVDWSDAWSTRRAGTAKPARLLATTTAGRRIAKPIPDSQLTLSVECSHEGRAPIAYNDEEYGRLGDFLCFAYGASRRMGSTQLGSERYSTASVSLFDDDAPLINVEEFFLQADYDAKSSRSRASVQQRDRVKALLIDILPEVTDLRIARDARSGRVVEVRGPFGWVRLNELSLGFKSLIAWLVDFASRMYHYHRTKEFPFREPAVVLIDEIDLHLHPSWQRRILGYLSRKFPNTQFIATAHSPLIVQAALEANLVLLKRRGSHVGIENAPDVIKSWRIDQILTSDIFGLSSARSDVAEGLLKQRRTLLMRPKLTREDKQKIERLEEKIGLVPVAETPEYIQAMEIIKKAAGRRKPSG